jgi:hypothetical protein
LLSAARDEYRRTASNDTPAGRAVNRWEDRMSQEVQQPMPRLAIVHALVFTAGVLLAVAGIVAHVPHLLVVAGPCLVFAGCMVALGIRITLQGPLGHVMRAALGRTRVLTRYMRAVGWILAGILVTAWGLERIRAGEQHGPPVLQDPAVSQQLSAARVRPTT